MRETAEAEARRALARLRRSLEKAERELRVLEAAVKAVDGDASVADFVSAWQHLEEVAVFAEQQAERMEERRLSSAGLTLSGRRIRKRRAES